MTLSRLGAALGAAGTAVFLVLRFGILPPDMFLWLVWLAIVSCGGALGGGLALAWEHVTRAPRIGLRAALLLLPVTLLILWSFHRDRRAAPGLLASADSVRGVVTGRNVFGSLLITYHFRGQRARLVASRSHAHARFAAGDSIRLYFQRQAPHRLLYVWPPGPDLRAMLWRVFWLWLVGGAVLAGYGPRVSRRLGKPLTRQLPKHSA